MVAKKKKVSSWKAKKVYTLLAPENFEHKEIGTTVADDPQKLIGRSVNVTVGELTKERSKNYLNLVFEIFDVKSDKAHTCFKKFFIPVGYLRSKVRKRTKKIDYMGDIKVGEKKVRLKIMVLSRYKISDVQKRQIKEHIDVALTEHAGDSLDKFVQQTLYGKVGTEIYKKIKLVCPVMRVEVHNIQVLK